MTKINIAELLENCPKGIKLYSPIFGDVYLCRVRPSLAVIVRVSDRQEEFLYDGRFGINGECMLFPSKENRDWSTFQRPFKDGDVVSVTGISWGIGTWIGIFKQYEEKSFESYCSLNTSGVFRSTCLRHHSLIGLHLANNEEKKKLFEAIKENGYQWDPETKTLEKLITLKFKIGDQIRAKGTNSYTKILGITWDQTETYYETLLCKISVKDQDKFELVPNKFSISTLKPFESRVLVRDYESEEWYPAIWGLKTKDVNYPYGVVSGNSYKSCIPYEGNEHLLGTTNDCDNYYKIWE